jgi:dienelactone hydrolase
MVFNEVELMKIFKVLMVVMFATVAHAQQSQEFDVKHSWDNAEVHIPGKWFPTNVNNVKIDRPMPVVIYLHGCTGISDHDRRWANQLKKQGYVVVMPNSLSIPGRVQNCDPSSKTTSMRKVPVNKLRPLEAQYAVEQAMSKSWVDKNNIFLMGHSEGGVGVTLVQTDKIKGVVVSGYPCSVGVWLDASIPILAIGWSRDDWFKDRHNYRQCDRYWGLRNNSKLKVLDGTDHNTAENKEFQNAVFDFLNNLKVN